MVFQMLKFPAPWPCIWLLIKEWLNLQQLLNMYCFSNGLLLFSLDLGKFTFDPHGQRRMLILSLSPRNKHSLVTTVFQWIAMDLFLQ